MLLVYRKTPPGFAIKVHEVWYWRPASSSQLFVEDRMSWSDQRDSNHTDESQPLSRWLPADKAQTIGRMRTHAHFQAILFQQEVNTCEPFFKLNSRILIWTGIRVCRWVITKHITTAQCQSWTVACQECIIVQKLLFWLALLPLYLKASLWYYYIGSLIVKILYKYKRLFVGLVPSSNTILRLYTLLKCNNKLKPDKSTPSEIWIYLVLSGQQTCSLCEVLNIDF